MKKIILTPTATECIETKTKRTYWSLVENYTKTDVIEKEKEMGIGIPRTFLEKADIEKIRSETEKRLSKGEKVRVIAN